MLLKLLYTRGSLHNTPNGVAFSLKNRLDTVRLTSFGGVRVGEQRLSPEQISLDMGDGQPRPLTEVLTAGLPKAAAEIEDLMAVARDCRENAHATS